MKKMCKRVRLRDKSRFGMYFETGQGAEETNGQGKGVDVVILEGRKYGFCRGLIKVMREARTESKSRESEGSAKVLGSVEPWVVVNNVAGFIGPEVFSTKEQLVRVCLEDTVMAKLHGLTAGLDICCTLHMNISLGTYPMLFWYLSI